MDPTTFQNLNEDAIDMLKAAGLDKSVELVIKMVSEGKRSLPREINRAHMIDALCYLMTEFEIVKVEISKLAQGEKSLTATQSHEDIHTEEKPIACSKCDDSFASATELKVHEGAHTGEKPFTCAKCNKTFTQKAELEEHESTHNDKKLVTESNHSAAHTVTKKVTSDKSKTCRYYLEGRCKFGQRGQAGEDKCRFLHPKPCRNFKKKAGCKTKNCEYMHPKVCKFAFQNKRCPREDCSFFHPIRPTSNTGASNVTTVSRNKPDLSNEDGLAKVQIQTRLENPKFSSMAPWQTTFLEQQQEFQIKMLQMMQGLVLQRSEKNNNIGPQSPWNAWQT